MNNTQRRLTLGRAIAITTLTLVLATGCGTKETPAQDIGVDAPDRNAQGNTHIGSADAIERRAAQESATIGSADAIERQGNPSSGLQSCVSSADAAERLQGPCPR